MIYFSSDHHLGHKNIIRYMKRPFDNIDLMNECLIDNHNSKVTNKDTVYFLGDFCFNLKNFECFMKSLNGKKHFIIGNHDPKNVNKYDNLFESISQIKQIKVSGVDIVMCHYALKQWNKKQYGAIHLFGHSHGLLKDLEKNSFDIGVDVWNYMPVSFDEIKNLL